MDPTEEKIYLNGLNILYRDSYPKLFSFIKDYLDQEKTPSFKTIWSSLNSRQRQKINLEEEWKKLEKQKIDLIPLNSSFYPFLLKQIPYPPLGIYFRGNLIFDLPAIAVVGTRKASLYGKLVTEKIIKELVFCGFVVVSGLAYGIDSFAHKDTLLNKGKTVAVLASSVDKITPTLNKSLAVKILQDGAIVSEYPLNTNALKQNFPWRNRIISGLSLGTLVIEAKEKSGALITANFALEQNRQVFAIPGSIFNQNSLGPNNLIKSGAKLVNKIDDILEELPRVYQEKKQKEKSEFLINSNFLTEKEKLVFQTLREEEEVCLDKILDLTNLKTNEVMVILTELELKGLIKEISQGKYIKT